MNHEAHSWFSRRTYDVTSFSMAQLIEAKGPDRVSVVIPARDEAGTIGHIVQSIHDELVAGSGLVDELIVIDSDSTDDTADIARARGAQVISASEILPELGWRPGKGEAMWKSTFVTTGSILCFIDADLTTFSADFVRGLLTPLLLHDDISLVKAFYDRDLVGAVDSTAQGGRVTELTARPILSLWWPQLAGVIQPLGGEWAIRRELLESLSIPSGYGVELAVLIDTFERLGIDAIAQVDLGRRAHVHQGLMSLGALAAEVMAAAELRRFGVQAPETSQISHVTLARDTGQTDWITRPINTAERPPAASLRASSPSIPAEVSRP